MIFAHSHYLQDHIYHNAAGVCQMTAVFQSSFREKIILKKKTFFYESLLCISLAQSRASWILQPSLELSIADHNVKFFPSHWTKYLGLALTIMARAQRTERVIRVLMVFFSLSLVSLMTCEISSNIYSSFSYLLTLIKLNVSLQSELERLKNHTLHKKSMRSYWEGCSIKIRIFSVYFVADNDFGAVLTVCHLQIYKVTILE